MKEFKNFRVLRTCAIEIINLGNVITMKLKAQKWVCCFKEE